MSEVDVLLEAGASLGLPLTSEQAERLLAYRELLLSWNQSMNLVGETEPAVVLHKHLVDGLVYSRAVAASGAGQADSLVDVGSGNGLPGLVLAIALPQTAVTLLESLTKRCNFLSAAAAHLGLDTLTVLNARAEDAARQPELREAFAVAVARRVAALPSLLEYVLPLVRVGGRAVLAKGEGLADELAAAHGVPELLGGAWGEPLALAAPAASVALGEPAQRRFVVVDKQSATPETYPRRVGKPTKQPLRGR